MKVSTLVRTLSAAAILAAATVQASAARWGAEYVPNLPVVTQDGKTLHFYDDLIKNKIVILSFIYVSCRDICPLATARLAQVQDRLGDRLGRDVFIISISVDPENDTPEQLKKYAETFGAKPGWLFLTGQSDDIKEIRYRMGERSRFLGEHRNDLMLGNGWTGEWQRDSAMGDLERLMMVINSLNPAWDLLPKVETRPELANELFHLEGPPGETLFLKACSGCHTIGKGDRVGPDLAGVSQRRDREWLTNFISNPAAARLRKDPIAMELVAKYPVVRMPPLGVSEGEAADLIAYIEGRAAATASNGRPVTPASSKDRVKPLLALRTQDDKPFSTDLIKGRAVAVVFGFTHCPDICPTALLEWSALLGSLGRDADRMRVLFVSVDPKRDTPEVLKAYLSAFDERIIGLTGGTEEIAAVADAFNAFYEEVKTADGSVSFDHTVKTYLITNGGQPAGAVDFSVDESERLKRVRVLLAAK
jgi:protein SCO1/2